MAITITYPLDDLAPITLTLPGSSFEEPSGYITSDDIKRSLDGTLQSYRPFNKRRKALKWEYLTQAQKEGLDALWLYAGPFTFSDAVDLDNAFTALFMSAPDLLQIFVNGWAGTVEVQEI